MATITVIPNQLSAIPYLRDYLSHSAWVKDFIVNEDVEVEVDDFKKFNAETIQAIEDVQMGKNITTCKDFDDYLKRIKAKLI